MAHSGREDDMMPRILTKRTNPNGAYESDANREKMTKMSYNVDSIERVQSGETIIGQWSEVDCEIALHSR
jgi:hypothetical protein